MCLIDTAPGFEAAKKFLSEKAYDAAVLDIMGVNGYELLDVANQNGIPAIMLTAYDSGKSTWEILFDELGNYFNKKFGAPMGTSEWICRRINQ